MSWLISRPLPAVALLSVGLLLSSCEKETDAGVALPGVAPISTTYEDLPLEVATVRLDSVATVKATQFLVGRLQDDVSGPIEARSFLNLRPTSDTDSLPSRFTDPQLDSVVLVSSFDQVYGPSTTPARVDVLELGQKLNEQQPYNASTSVPTGNVIATNLRVRLDRTRQTKTLAPSPLTDTVKATVSDPTVRLPLLRGSGGVLGQVFAAMSQPGFGQAQLDAVLQGIALVPSASYSGNIVSLASTGPSTNVWFYYNYADAGTGSRRRGRYPLFGPSGSGGAVSSNAPRFFTQLITGFGGSPLAALAQTTQAVDQAQIGNRAFLQEGIGLGTRIRLTGLDKLRDKSGLAINRAELIVPFKPYSGALFSIPAGIYALEVDANNQVLKRISNLTLVERIVQADGTNPAGSGAPAIGTPVGASTTAPYFSMVLTSYLQAYLNNTLGAERPASLVLTSALRTNPRLTLNRAVVDAPNIRLRIYYSTLR